MTIPPSKIKGVAITQPATRSSSLRTLSLPKILWLSALLVTLVAAIILADTERRYLRFIESLDDVEVELFWVRTEEGGENISLHFEAVFRNSSDLTLVVEALNTQLFISGEYAGAYAITEGHHRLPPRGEGTVPLRAVLWGNRARLFQEARASGREELQVVGRARVRSEIGSLKVFYDVQGIFPISTGDGD